MGLMPMFWIRKICRFAFPLLLSIGLIVPVAAASSPQATTIAPPHIVVPQGSTTDDVIAVGQDADISGAVTDTVLVVNGTAHLRPTANVGLVVNIGGQVVREPGAQVTELFNLSYSKPLLESFAVGAALALGLETVRLAFSLVMILLPVLLTLLLGERLQKPITYLEQSIRRVGVIGLLTFFGCLAVAAILGVTVVGLPISALLLLAYAIVGIIGLSVMSTWVGRTCLAAAIAKQKAWVQTLAGAVLMAACVNIPAIGPILFLLIWLAGSGAVTAWLWQNWRLRKRGK